MKPFLKWAGGKSRLAELIQANLPGTGMRYVEPFLGSASVFLGISSGYGAYELSDVNPDLMTLYTRLVQEGEDFIAEVEALFDGAASLPLYTARRTLFNGYPHGAPQRAPLFVWLNKHAFNGICRYNSKGGFNVPWNRMTAPGCPSQAMRAFIAVCTQRKPVFTHRGFEDALAGLGKGDVVYCDPPYLPLNPTGFTDYAGQGFSRAQHAALASMARAASARGAVVAISNHDVPEARMLYRGARIVELDVRRSVSASSRGRGKVGEILAVWGH